MFPNGILVDKKIEMSIRFNEESIIPLPVLPYMVYIDLASLVPTFLTISHLPAAKVCLVYTVLYPRLYLTTRVTCTIPIHGKGTNAVCG